MSFRQIVTQVRQPSPGPRPIADDRVDHTPHQQACEENDPTSGTAQQCETVNKSGHAEQRKLREKQCQRAVSGGITQKKESLEANHSPTGSPVGIEQ